MSPDELVEQEAARVLDLLDAGDRMWVVSDRTRREKLAAARASRLSDLLEWGHLFVVVGALGLGACLGALGGLTMGGAP